jgi:hypothetical protein
MYDVERLLNNIDRVYNSTTALKILKDFERVLDEYFDIYVYDNWDDGELLQGPMSSKYWVTCYFMWPDSKRPDDAAIKRLRSNNVLVKTGTSYFVKPKKIKKTDDVRPGTKKGKLQREKIFVVGIKMPKSLMKSVYGGQDIFAMSEVEDAELAQQPPVEDIDTGDMAGLGGPGGPTADPAAVPAADPLAPGGI